MFKSHNKHRKGAPKLRPIDYSERHGYIRGVVKVLLLSFSCHPPSRDPNLMNSAVMTFPDLYQRLFLTHHFTNSVAPAGFHVSNV